jgi:hypothetical protein
MSHVDGNYHNWMVWKVESRVYVLEGAWSLSLNLTLVISWLASPRFHQWWKISSCRRKRDIFKSAVARQFDDAHRGKATKRITYFLLGWKAIILVIRCQKWKCDKHVVLRGGENFLLLSSKITSSLILQRKYFNRFRWCFRFRMICVNKKICAWQGSEF